MASADDGIVLSPGGGKTISIVDNEVTIKAASADTGGAYGLIEYMAAPGFGGPPPHIHPEMEEAFYVLDGRLTFRLGDNMVQAEAGSFVFVPRGVVHTFSNPAAQPSRVLVIVSPGGFETFFEEMSSIVAKHGYPPPPDILDALVKKYNQVHV